MCKGTGGLEFEEVEEPKYFIKFSHDDYVKFLGKTPKKARLMQVLRIYKGQIPRALLDYDTKRETGEHFFLKGDKETLYLELIFQHPEGWLFTTFRRHTEKKFNFYYKHVGEWFKVMLV